MIKPYAVLFLPWLVARRQLPSIVAAGGGLAAALLLPAVRYGMSTATSLLHREWWRTVTETTAPNLSVYDNVSLAAMYFRWIGPGDAVGAARVRHRRRCCSAIAALVFLRRRGVTCPGGLEGGLLLTLMPLLSPQGWDYVFLIATPAIVLVANYEDRLPQPLRALTIVAAGGDRPQSSSTSSAARPTTRSCGSRSSASASSSSLPRSSALRMRKVA